MDYTGSKEKGISWDLYALALIVIYALLQLFRLPLLPQFMDIYYHILSAQGMVHSGGFTGWDSWQYAPAGRPQVYPPLFHAVLALLLKSGLSPVFLAKLFECFVPVVFLLVFWLFLRRNYHERMAFFGVAALGSSLSFYMSLLNHIPAALAMTFGLLSVDQFLHKRRFTPLILLSLCFYSHLGVPWVFFLAIFFYGLTDKERRADAFLLLLFTLLLSSVLLFGEACNLRYIKAVGFDLQENNNIRFKPVEYCLALCGLLLAFKRKGEYRFLFAFFLGSLVFLAYPFRFFSAEGYLAVIFLAAFALDWLFNLLITRIRLPAYPVILLIIFIEIFSPSIPVSKGRGMEYFDSAFAGMLFAKGDSIWSAAEYAQAAEIIKNNSSPRDIVYSTLNPTGLSLAAISGRRTANALLVEVGPSRKFDPFLASRIIVFPADQEKGSLDQIVSRYGLRPIGRTKAFLVYEK